jgi:hypothetical protein
MQHPKVQVVLLQHPSISKDQQVLLQLLQTSKELAAAAKQQCSGQLPVALSTDHLRHVLLFAHHWLPKHAGLLQSLDMQLEDHSGMPVYDGGAEKWSATVAEVAEALKHCARLGSQELQLQSLRLRGCPPGQLLLQLPAKHLTQLCAAVDFSAADSASHVARLTQLRSLDMSGCEPYKDGSSDALAPLTRLQHLTELHIRQAAGGAACAEAAAHEDRHRLPFKALRGAGKLAAAAWQCGVQPGADKRAAQGVLGPCVGGTAGRHDSSVWRRASSRDSGRCRGCSSSSTGSSSSRQGSAGASACGGHTALGLALQHLPASCSLTSLECRADFGRAAQQLSAVVRHAELRRLQLWGTVYSGAGGDGAADCFGDDVLAPLTALAQLTQLRLSTVRPAQLSQLPVQLVELRANLFGAFEEDEEDAEGEQQGRQQEVLRMGHLTALTTLIDCVDVDDFGDVAGEHGDEDVRSHPLGPLEVLPPHLRELQWQGECHSVAPLLPLQQLRQVKLYFDEQPPTGPQLAQLSSMGQLTELRLVYSCADTYDAAAADAWAALPLRSLKLLNWAAPHSSNKHPVMPGDVVGRLSALTQLTCLEVGIRMLCGSLGAHMHATPGQLAAALAPLTSLSSCT